MSELTKEELEAIDDILNDNTDDYEVAKPKIEVPKEKPKPLFIPQNSRYNSKTSLGRYSPMKPQIRPKQESKKCIIPCIGGPDLESGATLDLSNPKFCSNLICVSCDHKVIRFPNYKWSPNTDYLFLRNNYPDTVQKNLIPARGVCAYCCQCTFCEETSTKHLNTFNSTWACRGHY